MGQMDERTFEKSAPWWQGVRKCTVITKEGYVRQCMLTARESHAIDLQERDWGLGRKCWHRAICDWDLSAISRDIARIHQDHGGVWFHLQVA